MHRALATLMGAAWMLTVVGCGGGSPQSAFEEFQDAVKARDGERAWEMLSSESQADFINLKPVLKMMSVDNLMVNLGMTPDQLADADEKKIFVALIKRAKPGASGTGPAALGDAVLENVKVEGDKASASLKFPSKTMNINFVKQAGRWKVKMAPIGESGGGGPKPETKNWHAPDPKSQAVPEPKKAG